MRPGAREFRDASLTVSIPQTIPEHMRERTREISHVFVKAESRGKRLATALMNFVCQEADADLKTLILTAREYDEGGPDEAVLVAWYEKFGFQKLQDTPTGTFMARQVRERPRIKQVPLAVAKALHSRALH
jgi:GNAT superfamily N-acetyltransferase